MAEMVKGPKNTINLAHKVFKHERKHWEKILTSPSFDSIDSYERMKLLAVHPGDKYWDDDDFVSYASKNENALVAQLPIKEFIDVKGRARAE